MADGKCSKLFNKKFCGPPRETSRKLFKCVAESLYVSSAGANKSFNSGTIGEVSRVVQSVSASSICPAGLSLVGMMVGVQFVKKLAIIVSLPESLV